MIRAFALSAAIALAVAVSASPAAAQAKAQVKAGAGAKRAVPRAADGHPDLTGVWQPNSNRRGSWEDANAGLGVGGTGRDAAAPAAPASGDTQANRERAPYQPWAAKKVIESFNNRAIDDPTAFCLPPGVPRVAIVSLFPMQIIQTPQQVVMLYEYMNVFRVIPLNTKHPEDLVPTYMGDSVGHWEGDTLVVDVTGFNDKTWLINTGTFHTEALHVTERYTRVDRDQINYDVTIEDPNVLTKPWNYHSTIMLREGTRLSEYVCAENNLDPGRYEELLKQGIKFQRQ